MKITLRKTEKVMSFDDIIDNEDEGVLFSSNGKNYITIIIKLLGNGVKTISLLNLETLTILSPGEGKDMLFTHIPSAKMEIVIS